MTAETLIKLDKVGKQFFKGYEHGTLGAELLSLFFGGKPKPKQDDPDAFWALKDIGFEVRRGEVLGVLGHNGAGKTTLLRLLNGEFSHDVGEMSVRGHRSSLIDLTGGFSGSMTGRENIYFRGAHLGFDREFLESKEEEIIAFTELGDFIDSPVKTYSSGMLLRLGFAVTVLSEPDVLLVDEILSVGDFLFSAKCMRKMNELKRNAAIVQVSHVVEEIVNFADRAIVLDRGSLAFIGDPGQAGAYYLRLEQAKAGAGGSRLSRDVATPVLPPVEAVASAHEVRNETEQARTEAAAPIEVSAPKMVQAPVLDEGAVSAGLAANMGHFINNTAALADVQAWWCDADGAPVSAFHHEQRAYLRVAFTPLEPIHALTVGVPVWTADGVYVTGFATHARPINRSLEAGVRHKMTLEINALHLNKGAYYPVLAIVNGGEFLYRQPAPPLEVASNRAALAWGLMTLDYEWRQES